MTQAVSSHESSCLANCRPLHVCVHCRLIFVWSVQEASVCAYIMAPHEQRMQTSLPDLLYPALRTNIYNYVGYNIRVEHTDKLSTTVQNL